VIFNKNWYGCHDFWPVLMGFHELESLEKRPIKLLQKFRYASLRPSSR
jgi:hypothetical protein